jgi:hypothetical protein
MYASLKTLCVLGAAYFFGIPPNFEKIPPNLNFIPPTPVLIPPKLGMIPPICFLVVTFFIVLEQIIITKKRPLNEKK